MTGPNKRPPGKNSIRLKVGFLMILAIILLAITFYLLYRNLSSIVSSIKIDSNPELRLVSIREISSDIEKAGSSVRLYTVTKNPTDIKPYYRFISGIDEKISYLREECFNDSVLLAQTDTIGNLIEQNIRIWNRLLALYSDDDVVDNLRQLSEQLNESPAEPQKQGILRRVFRKTPEIPPVELEIAADLDSIVGLSEAAREQMAAREAQLAKNSMTITAKFYDLITRMENEVNRSVRKKAEAAADLAGQTYKWLILTAISGGLLAILILIIIIRYSRNASAYQVALENSRNEAVKLARTKEMFMANMSHEIRTPVTAISGFTDQLIRETKDDNTLGSLKIIKSSSDHLLRIINDILDFSKLQNNKLALEKVHFRIDSLVKEVFGMFENMALNQNTKLNYYISPAVPPVLLGDPYRLKQIFINLIGNSVKFTKNGSVNLNLTAVSRAAGETELVMEFSDTGVGIDESGINSVFEDFTQAEMSTTRKFGGTGLGLSIVKKLIELQKGTIDLASKKNRGTTIVCRLPFLPGEEKLISKEPEKLPVIPDEIKGLSILVVDDEEYNRLLFSKIFERWNIKCDLAQNGMEALEVLKEKKYDILFMDMLMPGIDGIKTSGFIRNEMKISAADMPILLISAAPPGEEWEKYRNAGINFFVQKPFTEEDLLSSILAVIGERTFIPAGGKGEEIIEENKTGKVDLGNLIHISGGDNGFIRQMLETFINTTEAGISDLQNAASGGDSETVAGLCHKLQPPCRHLGAKDLYALLAGLENTIKKNENPGNMRPAIDEIISEFELIRQAIKSQISKIDQNL